MRVLHKIGHLCNFLMIFFLSFFGILKFHHTFVAYNFQSSKKYNYVRN